MNDRGHYGQVHRYYGRSLIGEEPSNIQHVTKGVDSVGELLFPIGVGFLALGVLSLNSRVKALEAPRK